MNASSRTTSPFVSCKLSRLGEVRSIPIHQHFLKWFDRFRHTLDAQMCSQRQFQQLWQMQCTCCPMNWCMLLRWVPAGDHFRFHSTFGNTESPFPRFARPLCYTCAHAYCAGTLESDYPGMDHHKHKWSWLAGDQTLSYEFSVSWKRHSGHE